GYPYGAPAYGAPGYAPPPGYAPQPGYAQPAPPQPGYAPQPGYVPPQPQASPVPPAPQPPAPSVARPLLPALVGSAAWQAEVRAVVQELLASLTPDVRARVQNVPIVFDPNPNDVNAFASCDDSGAPFVAGTEGLLEAIDAIAQTKASDQLFGTQTYEAYVAYAAPRLVSSSTANAALPGGIIPAQVWSDPRRISRAHEMFDEIVAFTFGHELSHHYLGHTGCANGQLGGPGPSLARLGQLATAIVPGLNQPNEIAADTNGCQNTLAAGRARAGRGFAWNEEGGLWLLDFFSRLER